MKLITAIVFFLIFAFFAEFVGLAPIVGAFAAGLVLEAVHFKGFQDPELADDMEKIMFMGEFSGETSERNKILLDKARKIKDRHVEELVEVVGYIFIPIFFVITGIKVDLSALGNMAMIKVAVVLTIIALAGKLVCGLFVPKGIKKMVIGVGMAPRGEVGLIFANIGLAMGVVNPGTFAAVVMVVMLTTLITPPVLAHYLNK